ncbi:MAG: nitrile hydratase subunit beta [Acidiferrobacteraceae bacterium]|nr:nitrile hydratase subunit beta [Acidiferrobacteraceae bacterium]
MRGSHDLGGLEGLGSISPEPESSEPVFHAEWEKRIFALTLAVGFLGQWNLDQSRHARERQTPKDYLRHSYYENWCVGLKTLLLEKGLVSQNEFNTGKMMSHVSTSGLSPMQAKDVPTILMQGGSVEMETDKPAGFAPGDRVRVRKEVSSGHTRVPSYLRGRVGEIKRHHGTHVFADRNALGCREAEHLYSIQFSSREIWGDGVESGGAFAVRVDLWEPHLENQ